MQAESATELKAQGNELLKACRFEEAVEYYSKALACCTQEDLKVALLLNRGLGLFSAGQHERACLDGRRAITLQPQNSKAYYRTAQPLLAQKRYKDVVKLYEQALLTLPSSKFIRKKLVEAHAQFEHNQSRNGGLDYATDLKDPGHAWEVMKHAQEKQAKPVSPPELLSDQSTADLQFPYHTCPSNLSHTSSVEGERDFVRFVCISDTHSQHHRILPSDLPPGDVLLHAGDFTQTGELDEVESFGDWLEGLPYAHKVVIAGNHEVTFHTPHYENHQVWSQLHSVQHDSLKCRAAITDNRPGVTYLEDSTADICGVKIYGSPWQPKFCEGWGYNLARGSECRMKWDAIPADTHILLTHTPPVGYGDRTSGGRHVGCVDLLQCVQQRVRPLLNVFGHIHSDYGITRDHHTTYVNASTCDMKYAPSRRPIVFDVTREDLAGFADRFRIPTGR